MTQIKVYKELLNNSKKRTSCFKNWAKDLNRHFTKQDIQMAHKNMKKCPTKSFNKDMQN